MLRWVFSSDIRTARFMSITTGSWDTPKMRTDTLQQYMVFLSFIENLYGGIMPGLNLSTK